MSVPWAKSVPIRTRCAKTLEVDLDVTRLIVPLDTI